MRSSKLFKQGSFIEELAVGMQEKLIESQNEKMAASFNKLAKAVDYLNMAAEIFDQTGMNTEAEVLTRMLERLANKKTVKKADLKEELTPEELEFFNNLSSSKIKDLFQGTKPGEEILRLKNLHKTHKDIQSHQKKQPEIVEFESLLPRETEAESAPGGDIIEIKSLIPEFEEEITPEEGEYELFDEPKKKDPPPLPR